MNETDGTYNCYYDDIVLKEEADIDFNVGIIAFISCTKKSIQIVVACSL